MSTNPNTDRELVAVAYGIVLIVALIAGLELASLLATGHVLAWRYLLSTLIRLPTHGTDAYPAFYRRWLPHDMTIAIAAGVAVGALVAGVGWWQVAKILGTKKPKGARWATPKDLRSLYIKRPQAGRLVLGRFDGQLIAATDRMSTLVMGPPQQGKTAGLVIPAIMEWQGPTLTTSVKPDVYFATRDARGRAGNVKVFDPLGRTGVPTSTWSPVAAAETWTGARATAALLMQTGWEQMKADREPHWRLAAARHLAPLLMAAHHGKFTLGDVMRWIHTREKKEMLVPLISCPDPHSDQALENIEATWKNDTRYVGSVYATLEAGLDPWQEPGVLAATSTPDITAEWLLSGNNTLYLVAPERDQSRLANLFAALVTQVIGDALILAAQRPGQRLDPPLLVALDEVANIAPIPNLAEIASTGLGPGVLLLTVLQNYAQAREKWGAERASNILGDHTCKVFCSGISDPDTLDYIRRLLGDEVVEQVSRTRGSGRNGSTTVQPHREPLAPAPDIREGAESTAILVCGRVPPARIQLRPWWQERSLRSDDKKKPVKKEGARVRRTGPKTQHL